MLVAYTYKLSPSRQQVLVMDNHLEMLRLQYNFRIRERTEAYEQVSAPVLGNYCDLRTKAECCPLTCSVSKNALYGDPWTPKGKKRGALAQQDADLPNLKRERASRKKKGSVRRRQAYSALARLEQKVERQRTDYQWKAAHQLVGSADCVIFEDLNIKNMMARCKPKVDPETGKYLKNSQAQKRGLNRAIADAAWGELKQKVKVVAAKSGVLVHQINPKHTSQECSCCGYVSPANRDKEKFLCESCGWIADADVDAAAVIRQRGLSELGINIPLPLVHGKVTLKEPVARQGTSVGLLTEPENPRMEWEQLSLFEWREE